MHNEPITNATNNNFPRGIELVGSIIIENENEEILLTKSTKWGNKWVLPGGHIEPGEKILDAMVREGEEETGLKIQGIAIYHFGELINSNDFHRPAHFIFFNVYGKSIGGSITLDPTELTTYQWIKPKESLRLDLAESYSETIEKFLTYKG